VSDPELTPKRQLVRAAERLFARQGLEGVSLREIGAAAGNANNSAVRYHFGSKDRLVRAIFEDRLGGLEERRRILMDERRPVDVRGWVECQVMPILEQGERPGSHYLSFLATVMQSHDHVLSEWISDEQQRSTQAFLVHLEHLLSGLPPALLRHRVVMVLHLSVYATADRERDREQGRAVLPFAIHSANLIDALVGCLQAPASTAALQALAAAGPLSSSWTTLPGGPPSAGSQ